MAKAKMILVSPKIEATLNLKEAAALLKLLNMPSGYYKRMIDRDTGEEAFTGEELNYLWSIFAVLWDNLDKEKKVIPEAREIIDSLDKTHFKIV